MDNPGWWVKIDLVGTALANRTFVPVERGELDANHSGPDWLRCTVEDGQYRGAGDPGKLEEIIAIFLAWMRA